MNDEIPSDRNLFGLQNRICIKECKPKVLAMSIGERIKQARHMRGLNQRELAKGAGVSAQAIS